MAYTPTTWTTGDTITATALNKIENGIANAGSAFIIDTNGSYTNAVGEYEYGETLNATFLEIYEALSNGTPVYIRRVAEVDGPQGDWSCCAALYSVLCAYKYDTTYRVYALSNADWNYGGKYGLGRPALATFSANSVNDYPVAMVNTIPNAVADYWD